MKEKKSIIPKVGGSGSPREPMRGMLVWLLALLLFLVMFRFFSTGTEKVDTIPYNPDFIQLVEQGKVRKCEIVTDAPGIEHVRGELAEQQYGQQDRKDPCYVFVGCHCKKPPVCGL